MKKGQRVLSVPSVISPVLKQKAEQAGMALGEYIRSIVDKHMSDNAVRKAADILSVKGSDVVPVDGDIGGVPGRVITFILAKELSDDITLDED